MPAQTTTIAAPPTDGDYHSLRGITPKHLATLPTKRLGYGIAALVELVENGFYDERHPLSFPSSWLAESRGPKYLRWSG